MDCICRKVQGDVFNCAQHGGEASIAHLRSLVGTLQPEVLGAEDAIRIVEVLEEEGLSRLAGGVRAYLAWLDNVKPLIQPVECHARRKGGKNGARCGHLGRYKIDMHYGGAIWLCGYHASPMEAVE